MASVLRKGGKSWQALLTKPDKLNILTITKAAKVVALRVGVLACIVNSAFVSITDAMALQSRPATVAQRSPQASTESRLEAADVPIVPSSRIARPTLMTDSQGEAVSELQAVLLLLGFYDGPITGQYQASTQEAVKQFQAAAGLTADGIVGPATWSRLFPAPPTEAIPPGIAAQEGTAAAPAGSSVNTPSSETAPGLTNADSSEDIASVANTSPPENKPDPPTNATANAARPLLRLGDRGEAVKRLQERLSALGFYQGAIDGIFGELTEEAVKNAQANYQLTDDGIVGPATWNAIDE